HPSILDDLGLTATLRAECAAFSKQHGIPARFLPHNVPESLPSDISLSLYRIAQESLWNAAKHAEAKEVLVTLTGSGEEIVLAIHDDGNGFDLAQIKGKGGLGLVSMEERVRLVNGGFSVTSEPGKGTSVAVRVPLSGT
ncbi:MAG: PAS domain S-box protein, partial [Acidobacteria bacterium]|nr:PAS domain S-box protein [Acidobacteriota bacterium]